MSIKDNVILRLPTLPKWAAFLGLNWVVEERPYEGCLLRLWLGKAVLWWDGSGFSMNVEDWGPGRAAWLGKVSLEDAIEAFLAQCYAVYLADALHDAGWEKE